MTENKRIVTWYDVERPGHREYLGYVGKAKCFFATEDDGGMWWLFPSIPWDTEVFAADGIDADCDEYFLCASLRDCRILAEDIFMYFFKDLGDDS